MWTRPSDNEIVYFFDSARYLWLEIRNIKVDDRVISYRSFAESFRLISNSLFRFQFRVRGFDFGLDENFLSDIWCESLWSEIAVTGNRSSTASIRIQIFFDFSQLPTLPTPDVEAGILPELRLATENVFIGECIVLIYYKTFTRYASNVHYYNGRR